MNRQHLGWLILALAFVATPALAQDEDEDDLLIFDEEEEAVQAYAQELKKARASWTAKMEKNTKT